MSRGGVDGGVVADSTFTILIVFREYSDVNV